MLLFICFECLVCLFIWWRGGVIALGDQPQHRRWDMVQRQRRADWTRNELQQRPVWWPMLSGLLLLVLADWFTDRWVQPPWRAAILWTIGMSIMLVLVVALTEHSAGTSSPSGANCSIPGGVAVAELSSQGRRTEPPDGDLPLAVRQRLHRQVPEDVRSYEAPSRRSCRMTAW